jgi:hypothetical protein
MAGLFAVFPVALLVIVFLPEGRPERMARLSRRRSSQQAEHVSGGGSQTLRRQPPRAERLTCEGAPGRPVPFTDV